MQDQWYIHRDDQTYGPYSHAEMKAMAQKGSLVSTDWVFKESSGTWVMASSIPDFFISEPASSPKTSDEGRANSGAPGKRRLWVLTGIAAFFLLSSFFIWIGFSRRDADGQSLGDIHLSGSSQIFEHEEIKIEFAGGQGDFHVRRLPPPSASENRYADPSAGYLIAGPLHQLEQNMQVTLNLPTDASAEDAPDGPWIMVMKEKVHAPSPGLQKVSHLLESTIDWETRTVTAKVSLETVETHLQATLDAASESLSTPANQTLEDTEIVFHINRFWPTDQAESNHFRVRYREPVADGTVGRLLGLLEEQKDMLQNELGFSFAKRTDYPILIRVKDLEDHGYYAGSKFSDQRGQIFLDAGMLSDENWTKITATAGHELMHLVQALHDPRSPFQKNHPWVEQPLLWLDEAVATWFEEHALGHSDHLPANASRNVDFVRTPLFLPGSTVGQEAQNKVQNHGYGASLFLRYMVDRQGDLTLPSRIYHDLSLQPARSLSPYSAMLMALTEGPEPSTLSGQWVSFLEDYFVRPQTIASDLETSSPMESTVLQVDEDSDANALQFGFQVTRHLEANVLSQSIGSLPQEEPAKLVLRHELAGFSAQALRIRIASGDEERSLVSDAGVLEITTTDAENVKTLVHAVSTDQGHVKALAGAENPLASDRVANAQSNVRFDAFGLDAGAYPEVIVILIHDDPSQASQETRVDLAISFLPKEAATEHEVRIQGPRQIAHELEEGRATHYFEAIPSPEGRYQFEWDFGDGHRYQDEGTVSAGDYTYTEPGDYEAVVRLYDLEQNFLAEDRVTIQILEGEPDPGPDISDWDDWDCGIDVDDSQLERVVSQSNRIVYHREILEDPGDEEIRQGLYLRFFDAEREQIYVRGCYLDGKEVGLWTYWYENGNVEREVHFQDGKTNGPDTGYWPNGNLRYEGQNKDQLPTGIWDFYDEDGDFHYSRDQDR